MPLKHGRVSWTTNEDADQCKPCAWATHYVRHVREAHFSRNCSQTYGAAGAGAGAGAGGSGGMAALVVGAWSFVTSSLVPTICLSMKS